MLELPSANDSTFPIGHPKVLEVLELHHPKKKREAVLSLIESVKAKLQNHMNYFQAQSHHDWQLIEFIDEQLWIIQQHHRLMLLDPQRYVTRLQDEYNQRNVMLRIKHHIKDSKKRMRDALDEYKDQKLALLASDISVEDKSRSLSHLRLILKANIQQHDIEMESCQTYLTQWQEDKELFEQSWSDAKDLLPFSDGIEGVLRQEQAIHLKRNLYTQKYYASLNYLLCG